MICIIQCSNSKRYLLPFLFFLFLFFFYPFFCKTGNTISRPRTKSVYYSKSYKVLTKLPTTSYNINPDPFRSAIRQVGKKKLSDFLERKQTKERNKTLKVQNIISLNNYKVSLLTCANSTITMNPNIFQ